MGKTREIEFDCVACGEPLQARVSSKFEDVICPYCGTRNNVETEGNRVLSVEIEGEEIA
jgi:DNA-directed RNA polymerase subunit RPC12/RpoP